ncbi:hypothetical protein GW17_00042390 [Ensete ventricosum]|nr:hypothetical protein GW17_00042390 [Ensete ventricosum]
MHLIIELVCLSCLSRQLPSIHREGKNHWACSVLQYLNLFAIFIKLQRVLMRA